jgi:hypothetical protein
MLNHSLRACCDKRRIIDSACRKNIGSLGHSTLLFNPSCDSTGGLEHLASSKLSVLTGRAHGKGRVLPTLHHVPLVRLSPTRTLRQHIPRDLSHYGSWEETWVFCLLLIRYLIARRRLCCHPSWTSAARSRSGAGRNAGRHDLSSAPRNRYRVLCHKTPPLEAFHLWSPMQFQDHGSELRPWQGERYRCAIDPVPYMNEPLTACADLGSSQTTILDPIQQSAGRFRSFGTSSSGSALDCPV